MVRLLLHHCDVGDDYRRVLVRRRPWLRGGSREGVIQVIETLLAVFGSLFDTLVIPKKDRFN